MSTAPAAGAGASAAPAMGAGASAAPAMGAGRAARASARRRAIVPPLPQREGLDPVRLRVDAALLREAGAVHADAVDSGAVDATGDAEGCGPTVANVLLHRFPPLADPAATDLGERLARGDMLRADGTAWSADDRPRAGEEIWFHRELAPEDVEDVELPILLHDEHLLVIDKPAGMATTPRGAHVLASALVRLRRATGIADLVPLHRLDRRTAGVLAFGVRPEERSAYQQLFARGEVAKEYRARVAVGPGPVIDGPDPDADGAVPRATWTWLPRPGERRTIATRLVRERGDLRTRTVPGEPNAVTDIEVLGVSGGQALLALHPRTGRTHQLRAQLADLGTPILGDDLYPRVRPESESGGDLQLLALSLAFTDPVTGQERALRSGRRMGLGTPTGSAS
ncbi:pseudouridine synthase [Brachybacterium nesterenkovii]|uniref:pseudouridine synthase n=1 Tax=Brachybacterium nesterenkovii TaxID=47847 RepID=UPI00321A5521